MNIYRLQLQDSTHAKKVVSLFKNKSETIEQFLESENNILIGAFDEDKPVGILIGFILARPDSNKPMLYIHDIDVHEPYRRQKIATKMIEVVKQIAKKNNCLKIFLITNKTNEAAMKLYNATNGKTPHNDDIIFVFDEEL